MMVKKALTKYFNKINTKELAGRQLEFYSIYGHYWIELRNYDPKAKYMEHDNFDDSEEEEVKRRSSQDSEKFGED